jgi:hypothetical protein
MIGLRRRSRAPAGKLDHCQDDGVVEGDPLTAPVDDSRHQVSPDEVEGGLPAADPDPVAATEGLQVLVVAHGNPLVFFLVGDEVEAPAGLEKRGKPPVGVSLAVADGAGGERVAGAGRRTQGESAAAADSGVRGGGGNATAEADGQVG